MTEDGKTPGKLKVRDILNDLDAAELRAFVKNYARHDKVFDWILKSHFISKIEQGEEGEKYRRLLNELIKPRTRLNDKISSSHIKALSIIFKDFTGQMNDLLSTQDLTQAFYLSYHSLGKIIYLQNRFKIRNNSIEMSRREFLRGLDLILAQDLAPVFRQKAETLLKELVMTSYYQPEEQNLIEVLENNNVLTESDKVAISDTLKSKYSKAVDRELIVKTLLQLAYPLEPLAADIVNRFGQGQVYQCLKMLVMERKDQLVNFYLDSEEINYEFNQEVLRVMLSVNEKDYKKTSRNLLELDKSDIPVLEMKALLESIPDEYFIKSFDEIKSWVDEVQFDIKSRIYARAGRYEELIDLLTNEGDFEWVTVYDELLIREGYQNELGKLYQNIAQNYLNSHIGRNAGAFMEKLNARLIDLHQRPMLDRIHRALNSAFGHRKSLKELIKI